MLKTLVSVGFSEADAQVYIYLVANGPTKARNIADALKMHNKKLYRCLKSLQSEDIVSASSEYPARYSAVPFEKALDHCIKAKIEQRQALQESKEELLSAWRNITKKNSPKR